MNAQNAPKIIRKMIAQRSKAKVCAKSVKAKETTCTPTSRPHSLWRWSRSRQFKLKRLTRVPKRSAEVRTGLNSVKTGSNDKQTRLWNVKHLSSHGRSLSRSVKLQGLRHTHLTMKSSAQAQDQAAEAGFLVMTIQTTKAIAKKLQRRHRKPKKFCCWTARKRIATRAARQPIS